MLYGFEWEIVFLDTIEIEKRIFVQEFLNDLRKVFVKNGCASIVYVKT